MESRPDKSSAFRLRARGGESVLAANFAADKCSVKTAPAGRPATDLFQSPSRDLPFRHRVRQYRRSRPEKYESRLFRCPGPSPSGETENLPTALASSLGRPIPTDAQPKSFYRRLRLTLSPVIRQLRPRDRTLDASFAPLSLDRLICILEKGSRLRFPTCSVKHGLNRSGARRGRRKFRPHFPAMELRTHHRKKK